MKAIFALLLVVTTLVTQTACTGSARGDRIATNTVAGAGVGAVVGGPVGAVAGGAVGAAVTR